MNYERPELLERLAADFVVGLMRHRARLRFERLCAERPQARSARDRWEDRLLPMALAGPPVVPSPQCWQRLQQAMDAQYPDASLVTQRSRTRRPSPRLRWLAAAASLTAVLLLVGRLTVWAPAQWQAIAALSPANEAPLWQVERDAHSGHLAVRVVGAVTRDASKGYELWALPRGGGKPVSLGLLPQGGALDRQLTAPQLAALQSADKLAVSVEPAGGSPTGQPTGPIVIIAPVQRAG